MVRSLKQGIDLPKIELVCCDGEIQIHDGHHRMAAYWLAGRKELERHEFLLLHQENYPKPRFGKIRELISPAKGCSLVDIALEGCCGPQSGSDVPD